MEKVGKDGVITVEEGEGPRHRAWTSVDGMQFDKAATLSPYFVTDAGQDAEAVLEDAVHSHLTTRRVSQSMKRPRSRVLEQGRPRWASPCLIIAEDIEGEALATLGREQAPWHRSEVSPR